MSLYTPELEKDSQINIPSSMSPISPSSRSAKDGTRRGDRSSDEDQSVLDMCSGVDVLLQGESLIASNRLQTLS